MRENTIAALSSSAADSAAAAGSWSWQKAEVCRAHTTSGWSGGQHSSAQKPPSTRFCTASEARAYMVRAGEIGGFGGGSLEPPRRWLVVQWLGLTLGEPSCLRPSGAR